MLTNLTLGSAWSTRAIWNIPAICLSITTDETGRRGEMRNRVTEYFLSMSNHNRVITKEATRWTPRN